MVNESNKCVKDQLKEIAKKIVIKKVAENVSSDENPNIDVKFAEDCVYTIGINIKLVKIADEILLQQINKNKKILKQVLFKDGEMKHLIFEF